MKKLKQLVLKFLKAGLSRWKVAIAIAAGMTLGVFPIYGPVTVLGLGLAWAARLNTPILLAAMYSMTFVKPLLILPFLRLGERVFGADPMPISLVELTKRFSQDALGTLGEFGWSFLHAIVGWLVVVPFLVYGIYRVSHLLISRWHVDHNAV